MAQGGPRNPPPTRNCWPVFARWRIEEGYYWTGNTSHTFGIAKSTDDQLQCVLHESLPDDRYISGQFLTGFESKTLQANAILFEIAKLIRASEALTYLFIATPTQLPVARVA